MNCRAELLRLMADGAEHSGEDLAQMLGVTRAAVWKQLQTLGELGLQVDAAPRRGYQLSQPLDLLDAAAVRRALPELVAGRLRHLEVTEMLSSTNDRLLAVEDLPAGQCDACLAEFQQSGRGRRGRQWTSPFASGLCLSLSWAYTETPPQLGALSLAVGVAILNALRNLGLKDLSLKWPNDVLHQGRKLGGILIELRAEAGGPAYVVIGIGLNVRLPAASRAELAGDGVAITDLAELLGTAPDRNALAGQLLGQLVLMLDEFGRSGLRPWLADWRAADALRDQPVAVWLGEQRIEGRSLGIDDDGALRLQCGDQQRRFVSGEVSLREAGWQGRPTATRLGG